MQEKDHKPITLKSTYKRLANTGSRLAEYDLRPLTRWTVRIITILAIMWVAYLSFHLQAREKKSRFELNAFDPSQSLSQDQIDKVKKTFTLIKDKTKPEVFTYKPINPNETASETQIKLSVLESCRHIGQRYAAERVNLFELFFETKIFDIELLRGMQHCRDKRIIGILQSNS